MSESELEEVRAVKKAVLSQLESSMGSLDGDVDTDQSLDILNSVSSSGNLNDEDTMQQVESVLNQILANNTEPLTEE